MRPWNAIAERLLSRAAPAIPIAAVPPEDEAAFRRYRVELTARYATLGPALMILFILVWWPLDGIVMPDARYVGEFAILRTRGLVLESATLALFLGSQRARSASLFLGPVAYGALLGCIGYSLGHLGGSDLAWLADAFVGVLPFALFPVRLELRVVATLLVGLCLPVGYFLPFPDNWHSSAVRGQVSFVLFSIVVTTAMGDMLYRVLRRSFFQQRSLQRARVVLAELNASLSDRVASQTLELRSLSRHIERVQEAERRRLSRDLHDELAQELTAMRYTLARLANLRGQDAESVGELVSDLGALLDGTAATVRGFISDLRPRMLDELGLVAATEWLCERVRASGGITSRLTLSDNVRSAVERVDREIALTLFRVLQEAMTNAQRHAEPRAIDVSMEAAGDEITVEVRDDGEGFDPSMPSDGFGILGIRERVRGAGGQLTIESSPGRGCRIRATVPARLGFGSDVQLDDLQRAP